MPQNRDLKGMQFGMLKVLERTKERQNGYNVWRCQCECGNEILISSRKLLRGTMTDCGCVPRTNAKNGPIAENLAGRHFGEWKVLHRTENKGEKVMWTCQCSCGTKKDISAHDLKAGKTRSCRGPAHEHLHNRKDLAGKQFGRLTAMYPTDKRDQKGNVYWHCCCDCGNEADVTEDALTQGRSKSCGCLREEIRKNIPNTLHWSDGTCVEWLTKRKYRKDNASGFRGVFKTKNNKFKASIGFKRKRFSLGTFDDFEEAVNARMAAEHLIHDGFLKAYEIWDEKAKGDQGWKDIHPLIFDVEKVNGRFAITTNIEEL